jgi:hypothetical protein
MLASRLGRLLEGRSVPRTKAKPRKLWESSLFPEAPQCATAVGTELVGGNGNLVYSGFPYWELS